MYYAVINFILFNAALAFCFIPKKYLNNLNGIKHILKLNSKKSTVDHSLKRKTLD